MSGGERGPTGDHGQDGLDGIIGPRGEKGEKGEKYSSWFTRNLVRGYLALMIGVALSIGLTAFAFSKVTNRLDKISLTACEAGNDRSNVQKAAIIQSQRVTQGLDLQRLLNLTAEQEAEFKRLSREGSERNIAALPYVDCEKGVRTSPSTPLPG